MAVAQVPTKVIPHQATPEGQHHPPDSTSGTHRPAPTPPRAGHLDRHDVPMSFTPPIATVVRLHVLIQGTTFVSDAFDRPGYPPGLRLALHQLPVIGQGPKMKDEPFQDDFNLKLWNGHYVIATWSAVGA